MVFGQHMKLRWWQRGAGKDKPLDEAWAEAEPVKVLGRKAAEARYHFESNSVLIRKTRGGGTVVEGGFGTIIHYGIPKCSGCAERKTPFMPCRNCNDMVQC